MNKLRYFGILIFDNAEVLDNKAYCTHHQAYGDIKEIVPSGKLMLNNQYAKADKIYTNGEISVGVDLSFHLIERLLEDETA